MTFARYLSRQKERTDWIGDLARAAAKDPRFPWAGEPLDMDQRIRGWVRNGDTADALHAFQAALDEWHGAPYSLFDDEQRRRREKNDRAQAAFAHNQAKMDEAERERRLARRRELNRKRKESR